MFGKLTVNDHWAFYIPLTHVSFLTFAFWGIAVRQLRYHLSQWAHRRYTQHAIKINVASMRVARRLTTVASVHDASFMHGAWFINKIKYRKCTIKYTALTHSIAGIAKFGAHHRILKFERENVNSQMLHKFRPPIATSSRMHQLSTHVNFYNRSSIHPHTDWHTFQRMNMDEKIRIRNRNMGHHKFR